MQDTATPETGPVDAPASDPVESIIAEIKAGGESPASDLEEVTQELVNEAQGQPGQPEESEPGPEEDATDTAESPEEPEEGTPEEPEADETDESTEPKYTVKVNGEEREVPLSELLNGYSRTEDYKAKTAAVAEERREVEALKANIEPQLQAQYANQLEEATNLFAQFDPVLSEAQNINWEALKAQDPAAYVQAQDAVNERIAAIQRMNQHVAQVRQQASEAEKEAAVRERAERFDRAANKMVEERPDLADEAKFKAFANEAVNTLKEVGFSGDDIMSALDERVLKLADLAREGMAARAARQSLPERKVVQKSAVKPLKTDGAGSQTPKPRFPANATRDEKANWIVQQIKASGG